MNTRVEAAKVLQRILFEGASLSNELRKITFPDKRDQAFLQALCYGACRRYFYLDGILEQLLEKPLKEKDSDIYCLLLIGLFQLNDMRVPKHAAVAETVDAAEHLKKAWAKNFINAILRRFQREKDELDQHLSKEAYYDHPGWMLEKFKQDWPSQWKAIVTANNELPPLTLRVNSIKISREQFLEKLLQNNIDAKAAYQSAVILKEPQDVTTIPGYAEGEFSVQDGAAQLAARILSPKPGQKILDACAAPGGKTAHLLELAPNIHLTAVDSDASRLVRVKENLQRLSLQAKIVCADILNVSEWWDGELFDSILLDAPCSASGVIRRHPDIKVLRNSTDIAQLVELQKKMLATLWTLLKPGGWMLYSTCSVLKDENAHQIENFLMTHHDAAEEKNAGKQILPGEDEMDGFYYALLRKL